MSNTVTFSCGNYTDEPIEDYWQKEFYRLGTNWTNNNSMFLDSEYVINPDVVKSNQYRVDFWVPERSWAIEFLCGGNVTKLREHVDSFAPGGKYDGKDLKEWRVVQFLWEGQSRPEQKYSIDNPNLIVLDFTDLQGKLSSDKNRFDYEKEYFVEWICRGTTEKIFLKGHKLFGPRR